MCLRAAASRRRPRRRSACNSRLCGTDRPPSTPSSTLWRAGCGSAGVTTCFTRYGPITTTAAATRLSRTGKTGGGSCTRRPWARARSKTTGGSRSAIAMTATTGVERAWLSIREALCNRITDRSKPSYASSRRTSSQECDCWTCTRARAPFRCIWHTSARRSPTCWRLRASARPPRPSPQGCARWRPWLRRECPAWRCAPWPRAWTHRLSHNAT
mmetsp:Transcript_3652/g.14763  ORF Transcript_3652/g.14763 Transcript_3652/m.14763 type:complete len:214 (+) Transcript_3652:503-1144(+)